MFFEVKEKNEETVLFSFCPFIQYSTNHTQTVSLRIFFTLSSQYTIREILTKQKVIGQQISW